MTIPPASLSVDEEEQRFYAAIGKAITLWQFVDAALGFIFCNALGIGVGAGLPGNLAYYSIINFDTKLDMTNAALSGSHASPDLLDRWRPLYNRTTRRNVRRNYLAHYMVAYDQSRRPGYRFHLRPNVFNKRAEQRWGSQPPRINTCQIIAFGSAFEKLAADLRGFSRFLSGELLGRALESGALVIRPPQPPQISTDQNDKVSEEPPSPSKA